MTGENEIRFLAHNQIDKKQWDRCVEESANGLIYAYSFYLDQMSPGWNAIVSGNYESIMPLTWRRKWGITYLYQPFLAAQLGIFGKEITASKVKLFINSIPKNVKYVDIYLNEGNEIVSSDTIYHRANFLLDLGKSYEHLRTHYSENILRNIRKAEQVNYVAKRGIPETEIIELALSQMKKRDRHTENNFHSFKKLYSELRSRGMAETYGIYSREGELMSSCIFFRSHRRAYYILVGNNPAGRTTGSSHFLIDAFIKDNAGSDFILDFEGSDIESLARFYSGFGAKKVMYPGVRINRLPWLARVVKSFGV